jgi:hypothetical protein
MIEQIHHKSETDSETIEGLACVSAVIRKTDFPGRWAVLSVLARVADESEPVTNLACRAQGTLKEYYTLTQEEKQALANGDIRKIAGWVSKLDKCLSSWLLFRLSKE